jgi:hypothetical protein
MSSQITPNNINQNYPVAGVDNNSQGFRDNFTAIKNNFIVVKREIDDIMNKVVVKEPLTYGPSTDNNLQGSSLSNVTLLQINEVTNNLGTANGSITLNYAEGSYHKLTLNGSAVLSFDNFPADDARGEMRLSVSVANVAHTLSFDSSGTTYLNTNSIPGYDFSNNTVTFNSIGTYDMIFSSVDQGANVYVESASERLDGKFLSANTTITSNSLVSTGLVFNTAANVSYAFDAVIPFAHSLASTETHTFSVQYGTDGVGTGYYTVEQQADPDGAFTANTTTTSNSVASTVTTSSTDVKMARISGVYRHTANSTVTITAATSDGTLTVFSGAHVKVTPLI